MYCSSRNTGCKPPANQRLRRHYSPIYSACSTNSSQSVSLDTTCVYS